MARNVTVERCTFIGTVDELSSLFDKLAGGRAANVTFENCNWYVRSGKSNQKELVDALRVSPEK